MDLLTACKYAYRKHVIDDPDIGWDELGTILYDAIAEEIGDNEFSEWIIKTRNDIGHKK